MSARNLLDLAWLIPVFPAFGAVVLLLFGKRIGEPKDAGKAVFLAPDDSDYIMGMYVDGGMTRHPELASGG